MHATVNYHITSPEPQAFHIDADGEKGKIRAPVLVGETISVGDVRDDDVRVSFSQDSIVFVESPSAVQSFNDDGNWKPLYDRELSGLLRREIGAREIVIFDHTVRIDQQTSGRKPARNVHSDYSPAGAHRRLKDILGPEKALEWESGHFAFVNTWRPIKNPITTAPLGFVRPRSVSADDWVTIDLIYPDRKGQILGLIANAAHEWIYLSHMTPDEIAVFNIYDSKGRPTVAHSALDVIEQGVEQMPRMSIESRTLVLY